LRDDLCVRVVINMESQGSSAFEVEMAIGNLKRQVTKYWSNPTRTDYSML